MDQNSKIWFRKIANNKCRLKIPTKFKKKRRIWLRKMGNDNFCLNMIDTMDHQSRQKQILAQDTSQIPTKAQFGSFWSSSIGFGQILSIRTDLLKFGLVFESGPISHNSDRFFDSD